ncbi:MAG: malto-oligosyltrehalose trehalohydrolase [Sideroxyarcus sp.]|nr:malto-oligosyltrehalose trehalohydrolase [Sideroxyarcus sp.]
MKRLHKMPFGAEVLESGGVRFRLWAPDAAEVFVRLEGDATQELRMQPDSNGWHGLIVPDARCGSRYRYRVGSGELLLPDPASRFNPDDVHGASEVIAPGDFAWSDDAWRGRPMEEAVFYEVHLGTFSPTGDFAGLEARLDYLAELGITALEIMPVADFPGRRNWGYDGVLPYAPDAAYGRPEDFKRLVAAAHARGLMVLLDVVYNHFGPEGNYLQLYARDFFNPRHTTPWGAAINFDGPGSRTVRDFFVHNALYWLEEYHLDGLRLDAVHAIRDDSSPDIVEEIAAAISAGPGKDRHVHLILENDRNQSHYLAHGAAQWNDDMHHAFHVIATGESDGYYADYAADPVGHLGRCLAEGFAFQGEASAYRNGKARGEPSAHLPPTAFVDFLQTHDQIGNRAFGERLCHLAAREVLEAEAAVLLLAPQPPLLFMGEEFAAAQPFMFFCDFGPELAQAVTDGRRREFARFARFADPAVRERIPDPNADTTFAACVLDWTSLGREPHASMLALYRQLLELRRRVIAPRLAGMTRGASGVERPAPRVLRIVWHLGDDSRLHLQANLGPAPVDGMAAPVGSLLYTTVNLDRDALAAGRLPPWSVAWSLQEHSA